MPSSCHRRVLFRSNSAQSTTWRAPACGKMTGGSWRRDMADEACKDSEAEAKPERLHYGAFEILCRVLDVCTRMSKTTMHPQGLEPEPHAACVLKHSATCVGVKHMHGCNDHALAGLGSRGRGGAGV
eukprot:scaffold59752_cov16-Tisochrysis_lutea.AAC.1